MDRVDLSDLVAFLDDYLGIHGFSETAINGLQVDGPRQVRRVALAVDGVMAVFEKAADWDADLLIVHHGIFWGRQWPLRGPDYDRVKMLMDAQCALYAAHLPLDAHPRVGHAAVLLQKLGADPQSLRPFGEIDGQELGFQGTVKRTTRQQLKEDLEAILKGPVRLLPFGPEKVTSVACVTGQGANFGLLEQVEAAGIQFYVTGETTHPTYHFAQEHQLNLALGGHYRTECLGMRALEDVVKRKFQVETLFFDVPTGL